jgi:hypothetical protein
LLEPIAVARKREPFAFELGEWSLQDESKRKCVDWNVPRGSRGGDATDAAPRAICNAAKAIDEILICALRGASITSGLRDRLLGSPVPVDGAFQPILERHDRLVTEHAPRKRDIRL